MSSPINSPVEDALTSSIPSQEDLPVEENHQFESGSSELKLHLDELHPTPILHAQHLRDNTPTSTGNDEPSTAADENGSCKPCSSSCSLPCNISCCALQIGGAVLFAAVAVLAWVNYTKTASSSSSDVDESQ